MEEGAVFGTRKAIKMGGCQPSTVNDGCGRPLMDTGPAPSRLEKAVPLRSRDNKGGV